MQPRDKLTIALVFPTYATGGVERIMENLAVGFSRLGHDVHMVVADQKSTDLSLISSYGARLFQLPSPCGSGDLRMLLSIPALIEYLDREHPAIVLAGPGFTALACWLARRMTKNGHRLFFWVDYRLKTYAFGRWYRRLLPAMAKWFFPSADGIISSFPEAARDIRDIALVPQNRVHTLDNPVIDLASLERLSRTRPDHPWFDGHATAPFLAVGRLVPEKNYECLIHAFHAYQKERKGRLVILGEGDERPILDRLIQSLNLEDYVDMPGFVHNPYPYIKHSKGLVVSSFAEGCAIVLVEALALGTPAVSTDCPSGGPRYILGDGQYGTLVPVNDCKALTDALLLLDDKPSKPSHMCERALAFDLMSGARSFLAVFCNS